MMSTNGIMKALSFCLMSLCVFMLVACTPSRRNEAASYVKSDGTTLNFDNRAEACLRACSDDYDRCGDKRAVADGVHRAGPEGLFGGTADCNLDFRSCTRACKGP